MSKSITQRIGAAVELIEEGHNPEDHRHSADPCEVCEASDGLKELWDELRGPSPANNTPVVKALAASLFAFLADFSDYYGPTHEGAIEALRGAGYDVQNPPKGSEDADDDADFRERHAEGDPTAIATGEQ